MSSSLPTLKPLNLTALFKQIPKALKKVDPKERFAVLYPNWENAHVGMVLNILNSPSAERVFQQANEFLNKDLLRICLDGPKSEIENSLEVKHLAAFVTSHATMAKLASERPHVIQYCKAAGGIGVGFINSLVFSGAMKFDDALDLVQRQAQAIARARDIIPNARILVRVRPATQVRKVCQAAVEHCLELGIPREIAVCSMAKQIKPHVLEIAGHREAINYLYDEGYRLFEFRMMKRVVKDSYAYHTELMRPASDFIQAYIDQRLKDDPKYLLEPTNCSVHSATSGCRLRCLNSIKRDLYEHPVKPLKIEKLLQSLFMRPKGIPQPNILVLWDKFLRKNLLGVNRKAWSSSELLRA